MSSQRRDGARGIGAVTRNTRTCGSSAARERGFAREREFARERGFSRGRSWSGLERCPEIQLESPSEGEFQTRSSLHFHPSVAVSGFRPDVSLLSHIAANFLITRVEGQFLSI